MCWLDIEARGVERVGGGEVPDRGLVGGSGAVEAFEDPFKDTGQHAGRLEACEECGILGKWWGSQ